MGKIYKLLILKLKMTKKWLNKNKDYFYFAFRVLVGFMFFQHGAQKLFGAFGGNAVELMSLFGVAGIVEFFGGILIAIGLFTRTSALIGGIVMIGAWIQVHIPNGWSPIGNGGEKALLFIAAFLVLMSRGSKKWALGNVLFRKR